MTKPEVLRRLAEAALVPVVRAESADDAVRAAEAIREGGVHVLEIAMTVPGALGVMQEVTRRFGASVLVGAGTVLDGETARACIQAGARFVVGPVLDLQMVEVCQRASVVVIPGALTPTEVLGAFRAGADVVKVFPCGAVGGPSYIKSLKAPLPEIPLLPTGGVTVTNAADYIRAGAMALGVGADLVDTKAIREGNARLVVERAREYVVAIQKARTAA